MYRFRQGWIGIIGDVATLGPLLWRYVVKPALGLLSLGGDIDFYLEHTREAGWVGDMIDLIGHPLTQAVIIATGIGLIYWDNRRRAAINSATSQDTKSQPQKLEPQRVIAIGLTIIVIGVVVVGIGAWRSDLPTTKLQSELTKLGTGNPLWDSIKTFLIRNGKIKEAENQPLDRTPSSFTMGDASDGKGPFITYWGPALGPWPTTEDGSRRLSFVSFLQNLRSSRCNMTRRTLEKPSKIFPK
jgi:hypothetical protein